MLETVIHSVAFKFSSTYWIAILYEPASKLPPESKISNFSKIGIFS